MDQYQQPAETPAPRPRKSLRVWIWLLVGPYIALLIIALLQIVVHFVFSSSATDTVVSTSNSLCTTVDGDCAVTTGNPARIIVNILSILIGMAAVVCICLFPIWVVMLVKTVNYNDATADRRLNKAAAVIFAVVFGFWTWLYTYERDKVKFWVNLTLTCVTFGIWGIIAWIWSIIDSASKSDEYYDRYPEIVR
jgi:hypothetical protein